MTRVQREYTARLLISQSRAVLGEGPVWDERTQTFYWVDIERGQLYSCSAEGANERSVAIGQRVGCVAMRQHHPGFIAGLERSIAILRLDPLQITPLAALEPALPGRCNDGKCDAQGRFWVGTYDEKPGTQNGWLYRYTEAGLLQRAVGPYACVNGPAFSPTGRTGYCVDSYGKRVYRFELDDSGCLNDWRVFRSFEEPGWGFPDGLTCDTEGCVWVAHWGGSRVSRFSPRGELLEVVHVPVTQPTSCTFGGADLRRLFITSAALGLDKRSNANGMAGAVLAIDLPVGGVPAARYAG
jgi:D-xylonolactonase